MASPFEGYEVEEGLRPAPEAYGFDLDRALSAVVALQAHIPQDALTAQTLGTGRLGNGVVISPTGLVLTVGYLVTEATDVTLTLNDGRRVPAHPLGVDAATGLGLVQALEPLDLPFLKLGRAKDLDAPSPVIIAGGGGRAHAAAGKVMTRMPFAGYWEYLLEDAIMTEPAHPHWSGAALIGAAGELIAVGSLSLEGRFEEKVTAINMFIPIDLLPPILDDLARGRPTHPPRPWLGIITHQLGRHLVIGGVTPNGPASRAELRSGDVILALTGKPVSDLADFYTRLWALGPAGATVPLRIRREEDEFDVEIRSADRAALLKKPRFN